ncbi:MAG: small subunit ribosomal protein [Solirubrobacterales bacterium]|jgi:small subunit ribosomal protein S17|nr:small subunit ribosomal protein [Solirubrobacterales bacterium]
MAEEEKTTEETQPEESVETPAPEAEEAPPEEAPAAEEAPPEEAPAEETPAEETAAEEAPAEEAPAEDAPEKEAPVEEVPAEEAPAAAAAPAAEEEPEKLSPKQLRKLRRSQDGGEAKPQRSVEERTAERLERRAKASAERRRYRASRRAKRGEPGTGTPPAERPAVARKERQGIVVSSKADKTITVRIDVRRRHSVYEKVVRRSSTIHAHDEGNAANEGDVVRVVETRPLSRLKRWRLIEVVEKAK